MDDDGEASRAVEIARRIREPLEWDAPHCCKIQDLHEDLYDEACRLIKHHYFREEPMCKASEFLKDKVSVNCFLEIIKEYMKDVTSLVALSAATGRVVGVAVTRMNSQRDKTNTYSRNQEMEGETLHKIMLLINTLIRQTDAYDKFGCNTYLRIYVLCVHPSYQRRGVGLALMQAFIHSARAMKMIAVGGVFTSGNSQQLALNLGFRIFSEIRYSRWIVNEEVVFDDPGRGNYSAAFMGKVIDYKDPQDKFKYDE